jgi:hypothetical protein
MPFNSKVHQREEENVPRTISPQKENDDHNAAKHDPGRRICSSSNPSDRGKDSMQKLVNQTEARLLKPVV